MRRIATSLAAVGLGLGAVLGGAASASAAQHQPPITAELCVQAGGEVQPGTSPTGYVCVGGELNGAIVIG